MASVFLQLEKGIFTTFLHRELFNKKGLLKGKIEFCKRWIEPCFMKSFFQNISRQRILIRPILDKTLYGLWRGRRPNISYFYPFGCVCFLLNAQDHLGKFDSKVDKGIFLGYYYTCKAYRVFNSRTLLIEKSIQLEEDFSNLHMGSFDKPTNAPKPSNTRTDQQMIPTDDQSHKEWKFVTYHPQDLILGDKVEGVKTRSCALVSEIEPKNIEEALKDDDWIIAMGEELWQFTRNDVWKLVPKPEHKSIIETR
ncbi:hypothetical protein CR513_23041, partial [Mucuna pruriens]